MSAPQSPTDPRPSVDVLDVAATLNAALDGHNVALGLCFVEATRERVVAQRLELLVVTGVGSEPAGGDSDGGELRYGALDGIRGA